MGQFALLGVLSIVISLVVLFLGLGSSKGRFESGELKIIGPVWFILFMTGIVLIVIP